MILEMSHTVGIIYLVMDKVGYFYSAKGIETAHLNR